MAKPDVIDVAHDAPPPPPPPAAERAPGPSGPCGAGPAASLTPTQRIDTADDKLQIYAVTDAAKEGPEGDFLCIVRDGGTPEVLVAGHREAPSEGMEKHLGGFDNLVLAPDQRTLYFKSEAWAVENAVHAVDVVTRKERFVHAGTLVAILEKGPFKGMLVVGTMELDDQHPIGSKDFRGRGVVTRVITAAGKNAKKLPEDRAAMERVLGAELPPEL